MMTTWMTSEEFASYNSGHDAIEDYLEEANIRLQDRFRVSAIEIHTKRWFRKTKITHVYSLLAWQGMNEVQIINFCSAGQGSPYVDADSIINYLMGFCGGYDYPRTEVMTLN